MEKTYYCKECGICFDTAESSKFWDNGMTCPNCGEIAYPLPRDPGGPYFNKDRKQGNQP